MENSRIISEKKAECYIVILLLLGLFSFLFYTSFGHDIDSDFYHIVNSGRWIVEHKAVPYENYEFVKEGYHTVIQQWLYSVMLYQVSKFGMIGVNLFVLIQSLILAFCFYRLSRILGNNITTSIFCVFGSLFIFHYINCRPQMITVILLVTSINIIERYRLNNKKILLYILPLLTILEANVHVSCALFHAIVIMPYMVPIFIKKFKKYNVAIKHEDFIIPFLLCILATFVNPYKVDGSLSGILTVRDLGSYVSELQSPALKSVLGISFLITILLLVLLERRNKLNSIVLYFVLGFGLLQMLSNRNCIFLSIAICYELSLLLNFKKDLFFEKFNLYNYKITNYIFCVIYCIIALIYVDVFQTWNTLFESNNIDDFIRDSMKAVEVCDYLIENSDIDSVKVYTTFNRGAYFVYRGINHIYMQAKSEPYCLYMNKREQLMSEYLSVVAETDELEIQRFLDKYEFDYICVGSTDALALYYYLRYSDDYELVLTVDKTEDSSKYFLFRKVR